MTNLFLDKGVMMNNKIDDVMFTLLKAKEDIKNKSHTRKDDTSSYEEVINGLNNLVVNYTIDNKMTNKEIIDCAMSLYEHKKKNGILDKIKNLSPRRLISKTKDKIVENRKKKEIRERYETEIVLLVKDRLKTMIDDDRKKTSPEEEVEKDKKTDLHNEKESLNIKNGKSVFIFDKDIAKVVDIKKTGTFIFQDQNNYFVYRESDNISNSFEKSHLERFSTVEQAIIYSIDEKVSAKDVKNNFNQLKSNYGNLNDCVIDKRDIQKSHNINNATSINLDTKSLAI